MQCGFRGYLRKTIVVHWRLKLKRIQFMLVGVVPKWVTTYVEYFYRMVQYSFWKRKNVEIRTLTEGIDQKAQIDIYMYVHFLWPVALSSICANNYSIQLNTNRSMDLNLFIWGQTAFKWDWKWFLCWLRKPTVQYWFIRSLLISWIPICPVCTEFWPWANVVHMRPNSRKAFKWDWNRLLWQLRKP